MAAKKTTRIGRNTLRELHTLLTFDVRELADAIERTEYDMAAAIATVIQSRAGRLHRLEKRQARAKRRRGG